MSDYAKVLKGLRHCINLDGLEPNDTRIRCYGCPYLTEPTRCGGLLMRDAAAAIEELQATIELMKPFMPDFFPDANKVTLPKMEVQE